MNIRGWPYFVGGVLVLLGACQPSPNPGATPSPAPTRAVTPAAIATRKPAETSTPEPSPTQISQPAISLPDSTNNIYGHLESGDLVNGVLQQEKSDLWTFDGQSGHYATIKLTPNGSSIDLTLNLLDPQGSLIASMDNGFAGDLEVLTNIMLPMNGTYTIKASEFFNEEGAYQLSLQLTEDAQFSGGGRIEFAQEITTELPENSEHMWIFEGSAGQDISIILTSLNDQLDVILELRGPEGRQLALRDEGFAGDAELLTGFPISISGEYTILVRGFAGRGGSYSIYLDEGGESTINFFDAGDLSYGETGREILREDEAHAWFFEGQFGDRVTIEVSPQEPNMDMDIWLLDPELNEVAMKDEFLSGEPEKIEQALPADGQYLVLVREFFGEPGQYEIMLNASGGDVLEIAGTLRYNQTVQGVLSPGKQASWTFDGQAGDVVDITLTPDDPERDLVMVLLDPAGNPASTIDEALAGLPESLVGYGLTIDGEWLILIREFFNEGSGYELTLIKQNSNGN